MNDPFRFSTLAYPLDVTNNIENGHYLLFYVNVQNKTGYKYEGVTPTDGDFTIGDWVERVSYTGRYTAENQDCWRQMLVHINYYKIDMNTRKVPIKVLLIIRKSKFCRRNRKYFTTQSKSII